MKRLIIFCLIWLASVTGFSAEMRVVGSDLLGADFGAALEAFAKRENVGISMEFGGSRAGLDKLKSGKADMAVVALAPDEKIPDDIFVTWPLAYRVAVVVAPEKIGLTQVSFSSLEGVFGESGPAGFSLWRDLGVSGSVAQLGVTAHVLDGDEGALSVDLFTRVVLRRPKLKSSVQRYEQFAGIRAQLAVEEGGLAVLPYVPPAGSGLRVVSVAKNQGEPAFGPTPENIHTGDYPFRLPLYVVYRRENAAKLKLLLDYLRSENAARSLAKNRALTPVPASGWSQVR